MGVWFNGASVTRDPAVPIGALCEGLLSRGTFITVRFTPRGIVNAHRQRARLASDAASLQLSGADEAFAALAKRWPGNDATGRVALGPEGCLVSVEPLRRKMWAPGSEPLTLCSNRVREVTSYKSIERQELDTMTQTAHREAFAGSALLVEDEVVDGTFFHVAFLGAQGWFFPPGAQEGATAAFARGHLTFGPAASWQDSNGALALSSLLGAAPIRSIAGVSWPVDKSAATAAQLNETLLATASHP